MASVGGWAWTERKAAERLHLEAIERLGRTCIRVELAQPISCMANGCAASVGT